MLRIVSLLLILSLARSVPVIPRYMGSYTSFWRGTNWVSLNLYNCGDCQTIPVEVSLLATNGTVLSRENWIFAGRVVPDPYACCVAWHDLPEPPGVTEYIIRACHDGECHEDKALLR